MDKTLYYMQQAIEQAEIAAAENEDVYKRQDKGDS